MQLNLLFVWTVSLFELRATCWGGDCGTCCLGVVKFFLTGTNGRGEVLTELPGLTTTILAQVMEDKIQGDFGVATLFTLDVYWYINKTKQKQK